MNTTTAFVLLGKTGDLISCLPGFQAIAERIGEKVPLFVSTEFVGVLDGVSYVQPFPFNGDWKTQVPGAKIAAQQQFREVIVIPWWLDSVPLPTQGNVMVSCQGRTHRINIDTWPDVTTSMFSRMGFNAEEMQKFPLLFDRRDLDREKKLVAPLIRENRPLLLYNLEGHSSPLPALPEVWRELQQFSKKFKLVDLSKIHTERIYDLLGLFDVAAGLVTVDTATLPLAIGSPRLRYFAFLQDGWSGSNARGNAVTVRYFEATHKLRDLACFIETLSTHCSWQTRPPTTKPTITLRRSIAIGDIVAATVVADKLIERGHRVIFQAHPDMHCVLNRHPGLTPDIIAGPCDVDFNGAYESDPDRKTRHFSEIFMDLANKALRFRDIDLGLALNCRPRLAVPETERQKVIEGWAHYPRPWIMICPASYYFNVRTVPKMIWTAAMKKLPGTKFWLGREGAPAGCVHLHETQLATVILHLAAADILVTVDTGPMHIAAALGVPVVVIEQSSSPQLHLGDQRDWVSIAPTLECLNCQLNACPINRAHPPCQQIDPDLVASAVNARLRATQSEDISCVIPIFRPDSDMLGKCLGAVLPQVSEVVITRERGGIVPSIHGDHPKIKYVTKPADGIGFGRNVNYGFRHTNGKYVLVLNDDVYLNPDAVERLMQIMTLSPKVGVVGQLLRYPNGTIYHAGKVRDPNGGIGFPHIDYRQKTPTITKPCEMENTNGASVLFNRRAFYDAQCFDEEVKFYTEDDLICMELRRAGWQVWYTPHAGGIHDEHAETRKLDGINEIMRQSNERFGRKWGEYFRHNAGNRGLGNFDYLAP